MTARKARPSPASHTAPSTEGIAGAPFMIYHAEVTEDSDGPVEWCWLVPGDQAAAIAARFPDLTLRTEPARQEAFIHLGQRQLAGAGWQAAGDALYRWTFEQHRTPNGGPRMILTGVPSAGGPARRPWPGLRLCRRAAMSAGQTIEVRGLTKRYGATPAVDGLSFTVRPGLVTGFLGLNGAGKTTTMRLILGLERPTRGEAELGGRRYQDLPAACGAQQQVAACCCHGRARA